MLKVTLATLVAVNVITKEAGERVYNKLAIKVTPDSFEDMVKEIEEALKNG